MSEPGGPGWDPPSFVDGIRVGSASGVIRLKDGQVIVVALVRGHGSLRIADGQSPDPVTPDSFRPEES